MHFLGNIGNRTEQTLEVILAFDHIFTSLNVKMSLEVFLVQLDAHRCKCQSSYRSFRAI